MVLGGGTTRRGPEDDARNRRATEREGRRARRRRARELASNLPRHVDGMSSDDEVTEQQNIAFKQAKGGLRVFFFFSRGNHYGKILHRNTFADDIDEECKEVLADVVDDFGTVKGVLSKLESWKQMDLDAYKEAYVSLCIPKMISPIVRLQLVSWNPILV